MNSRILLFGFIWLASAALPTGLHAQSATDNPSVTAQLEATKPIIAKIKKDAAELQSFSSARGPSWQSHAAVLTRIKEDVNKLQENMRGLQSHRTAASTWQQDAIDRVTSLANDLATNMNKAMDHLNKNKTRPTTSPYPEYLKANTQIVNALSEEIDGTIDYGENKAKMDALEKTLPE
jgi:chromosome segregation ATPase